MKFKKSVRTKEETLSQQKTISYILQEKEEGNDKAFNTTHYKELVEQKVEKSLNMTKCRQIKRKKLLFMTFTKSK